MDNETVFPWDDGPHHLEKTQLDESYITESPAGFVQKLTSMIGRLTRRRDFFQKMDDIKEGNQNSWKKILHCRVTGFR
ncbi:hypothetical protein [Methanohalophilus sp.]